MDDASEARIRAYERWICEELAATGGSDPRGTRGTVLDFPFAGEEYPSRATLDQPRDRSMPRRGAEQGAGAQR